jgi:hypothetical protein
LVYINLYAFVSASFQKINSVPLGPELRTQTSSLSIPIIQSLTTNVNNLSIVATIDASMVVTVSRYLTSHKQVTFLNLLIVKMQNQRKKRVETITAKI